MPVQVTVATINQVTNRSIAFQDLNPSAPISEDAALALFAMTYVGLSISLVCLICLVVTYLSSRYNVLLIIVKF